MALTSAQNVEFKYAYLDQWHSRVESSIYSSQLTECLSLCIADPVAVKVL